MRVTVEGLTYRRLARSMRLSRPPRHGPGTSAAVFLQRQAVQGASPEANRRRAGHGPEELSAAVKEGLVAVTFPYGNNMALIRKDQEHERIAGICE